MKVLSFADYHLGVKTHGKIDPITGLNTREIQTLEVLDELIDYAINNQIKVIVAAGDMYKNNLPTPTLQDKFNEKIKRASDAGITVLILDGNHDVSKMDTTSSALKQFETLAVPKVIHTRFHKEYIFSDTEGNRFKFIFLPTYHTADEIKSITEQTIYDGAPIIYIGHMTVKGAMLNDWLIEDKEVYVDKEVFDKEGVAAVILGHLHKHQVLDYAPLIYYTGSTQRIDFNEEKQPKGFVVLDVDPDGKTDFEYVEIESQKFYTARLSYLGNENPTADIICHLNDHKEKIEKAIVRVQLELDEGTKIRDKEIYQTIYDLGAFNVLDIQKSYEYKKNLRHSELNEHISVEAGLEIYYKDKPRAEERIKLGREIIKKMEEEK